MISKILSIKNLRCFLNFSNSEEFKRKNVVYAINGIGKTNLSRLFFYLCNKADKLENLKSKEARAGSIEFNFVINGKEINQKNCNPSDLESILVYNSDFVEENIRNNDFSDKKIDGKLEIEMGSEQNILAELEKQQRSKENKIAELKLQLEAGLQEKITEIKSWDARGQNITAELIYGNLTKSKYIECLSLKEDRNVSGKNIEGWIGSKENFDSIKNLDPNKDKIDFYIKNIDSNKIDFLWIEEQLGHNISFPELPIDEIKQYIEKLSNQWIETGLDYHDRDQDHCPFCRLNLDEYAKGVIQSYRDHINSEKAKFENKIDEQTTNINSLLLDLKSGNYNNSLKDNFTLRSNNLNLKKEWQDFDLSDLNEILEIIKSSLVEKKSNPQRIFVLQNESGNLITQIQNKILSINNSVSSNKTNITIINNKLSDLANRQGDLRKLLGKKYLVEFYEAKMDLIDTRDEVRQELDNLKQQVDKARKNLPSVDVAEKIIALFNEFINQIGIDKYSAELVNGKIILKLKSYNISGETNEIVSEGEKNAIAFSYFLASSIRKLNDADKFSNSVFVIDDPICSMSYKYFYGVCNVIKGFHKTIQKVLRGQDSAKCPQLIIFTHNIQFYNMLVANVFKVVSAEDEDCRYFELEKTGDNTHFLRRFKKPEKLSNFKTALRRVKGYAEEKIHENIGNDIRRVLETLCHFHGRDLNQESLKKIFPKINGAILYGANDGSHDDVNNYEDPLDPSQYKEMSEQLISLLEDQYSELLKSLPSYG